MKFFIFSFKNPVFSISDISSKIGLGIHSASFIQYTIWINRCYYIKKTESPKCNIHILRKFFDIVVSFNQDIVILQ